MAGALGLKVALIALAACGPSEPGDAPLRRAFSLSLDARFGSQEQPEDAVLGWISDVAVDDRGAVYVLHHPPAITAFAPTGEVLWTRSQAGQGPGELQYAWSLAWDGGVHLAIANQSGAQLDLWSTDTGEFVRRIAVTDLGMRSAIAVDAAAGGGMVLAEALFGRVAVRVLGIRFEQDRAIESFDVTVVVADEELPPLVAIDLDVASSPWAPVTVGNDRAFDLRILGADGVEALRLTRPEFDRLVPTVVLEQGGTRAILPTGGLSAPRRLRDGHWLVYGSWLVDREDVEQMRRVWLDQERMSAALARTRFENSWWIFQADGTLVGENDPEQGRESRFGRLVQVDREGRILTIVQDPYPHVARWILEWEGKEEDQP